MRRRFAVPLIAAVGIAPWLWFYPEAPPENQPARFLASVDIPRDADWAGGFSGIEISAEGQLIEVITDRGHRARGTLARANGDIVSVTFDAVQPLQDRFGAVPEYPSTDAEGIAVDTDGRVYVSFEHAHRVLVYDTWGGPARWPGYTRAWRALSNNKGLEALAIAQDGTLYAFPEQINTGAWESLVYRRKPGGDWQQAFTLPVDPTFAPVGADFGPGGRFFVLERALYPFGFYSRVRAMTVEGDSFSNIETVFQSKLGDHGNLEGLAVWRDREGKTRLTMISDDNFLPFLRGQIVEYRLDGRVATGSE